MANLLTNLDRKNEFEHQLFTEYPDQPIYGRGSRVFLMNPNRNFIKMTSILGQNHVKKMYIDPIVASGLRAIRPDSTTIGLRALSSRLSSFSNVLAKFEPFPLGGAQRIALVTGFQGALKYRDAQKKCTDLKDRIGDEDNEYTNCVGWDNIQASLAGTYGSKTAILKIGRTYKLNEFMHSLNAQTLLADSTVSNASQEIYDRLLNLSESELKDYVKRWEVIDQTNDKESMALAQDITEALLADETSTEAKNSLLQANPKVMKNATRIIEKQSELVKEVLPVVEESQVEAKPATGPNEEATTPATGPNKEATTPAAEQPQAEPKGNMDGCERLPQDTQYKQNTGKEKPGKLWCPGIAPFLCGKDTRAGPVCRKEESHCSQKKLPPNYDEGLEKRGGYDPKFYKENGDVGYCSKIVRPSEIPTAGVQSDRSDQQRSSNKWANQELRPQQRGEQGIRPRTRPRTPSETSSRTPSRTPSRTRWDAQPRTPSEAAGVPVGSPAGNPVGSPAENPVGNPDGSQPGSQPGIQSGSQSGSQSGTPLGTPPVSPSRTPSQPPVQINARIREIENGMAAEAARRRAADVIAGRSVREPAEGGTGQGSRRRASRPSPVPGIGFQVDNVTGQLSPSNSGNPTN